METKHTPEPWAFDSGKIRGAMMTAKPYNIASVNGYATAEGQANGDRIVACVNALAGLKPEGVGWAVKALILAEIALGDKRIGTYDMDSPDWYDKVSKARVAVSDALDELGKVK